MHGNRVALSRASRAFARAAVAALVTSGAAAAAATGQPPQPWPWGARVDESMFAPGGAGQVVRVDAAHPAADDAAADAGSADRPYRSFAAAIARANALAAAGSDVKVLVQPGVYRAAGTAVLSQPQISGGPHTDGLGGDGDTSLAARSNGYQFQIEFGDFDERTGVFTPAAKRTSAASFVYSNGEFFNKNMRATFRDAAGRVLAEQAFAEQNTVGQLYFAHAAAGDSFDAAIASVTFTADEGNNKGNWIDAVGFTASPTPPAGAPTAAGDATPVRVVRDPALRTGAGAIDPAGGAAIDKPHPAAVAPAALEARPDVRVHHDWREFLGGDPQVNAPVHVLSFTDPSLPDLRIRTGLGRERTIVVEGAAGPAGQKGRAVISGSAVAPPETWTDDGNGTYSRDWKHDWGGDQLWQRREIVFVTPKGRETIRLSPVLAKDWKAEPGTCAFDEAADRVRIRLPAALSAADFKSALVEVPAHRDTLLIVKDRENLVLRNLVFQHSAADDAIASNKWLQPHTPDRNWLIEDLTVRHCARNGVDFSHVRDVTLRRLHLLDIGRGNELKLAQGEVDGLRLERSGWLNHEHVLGNLIRNIRFVDGVFADNKGTIFRNDHVAENLLIERCKFERNTLGNTMVFETSNGPITVRDCLFKDNDPGDSRPDLDTVVNLSTVHNITFDNCRFENNREAAIAFYPRERAHVANVIYIDELPNNLDQGKFDRGNKPDERYLPIGKKPAAWNRNFVIKNCTFVASGAQDRFVVQHFNRRDHAYLANIRRELRAYNNAYFNPANDQAFHVDSMHRTGTFAQWVAQSEQPDFEAGSYWGAAAPSGHKPFVPAPLPLATPGKGSAAGKPAGAGRWHYEAEALPVTASQPVEVLTDPAASGGKAHKLHAVQVGDVGDWVEYTLDVPAGGEYHVNVRYLQRNKAFDYLGHAQLEIDGRAHGPWWDQAGLAEQPMEVPLGAVTLAAGPRKFRFKPVWKNGYLSGDYDITVDRIELAPAPNYLDPPPGVARGETGLSFQTFRGDWERLPDFAAMTPATTGAVQGLDLSVAPAAMHFGVRFDGLLDVPADGIYTFYLRTDDGANLYVGDRLVVNSDGMYIDEKPEPWERRGYVALRAGLHPVRVDYFQRDRADGKALRLDWSSDGTPRTTVPAAQFVRAAR